MERWRPGMHYFSIPGGGIEGDESPGETALREIEEETGLQVELDRLVLEARDGKHSHHVYLCKYISGEPHLPAGSPEAAHGPENRFKPGWVPIDQLPGLPMTYWEPLKPALIDGLTNGFPAEVKIVSVEPNR